MIMWRCNVLSPCYSFPLFMLLITDLYILQTVLSTFKKSIFSLIDVFLNYKDLLHCLDNHKVLDVKVFCFVWPNKPINKAK